MRISLSIFTISIALTLTSYPVNGALPAPDKNVTVLSTEQQIPHWKRLWDEARELAQNGQLDSAIARYLDVLEIKPHIEEVKWELGRTYLDREQYSEALVILQGLLEASPGKIEYLVSGGEAALQQHKAELASRYFGQALSLEPGGTLSARALLGMIESLTMRGENALAIPLMEQLFQRGLLGPDLLSRLASLYTDQGNYAMAAFYYRELISKYRVEGRKIFEAAHAFDVSGNYEEAAKQWEGYLNAHPDYILFRIKLAEYYRKEGRDREALPHMRYMLEHNIDREQYLPMVARTYLYELGRFDRALYYFEQYRKEFPDGIDLSREISWLQVILANDLLAIVENDGVWMLWRDLAQVTPERIGIYRAMADMLKEIGREKENELIEVLKIINAHEPDDIDIISQLVHLYKKTARISECTGFMDQAAEINKNRAEFHLLRAECESLSGDDLGRLGSYSSFLNLKPEDAEIRISALHLAGSLGLVEKLEQLYNNRVSAEKHRMTRVDYTYAAELLKNGLARSAETFIGGFDLYGADKEKQMLLAREQARLDLQQNRPYKAEQRLRVFAADSTESVDAHLLLAGFFIDRKDMQSAKFWHDKLSGRDATLNLSQKSVLFYQKLLIDRALTKVAVYQRADRYLNVQLKNNRIVAEDVNILLFAAEHYLQTKRFDTCITLINRLRQKFKGVDGVDAMRVIALQGKNGLELEELASNADKISLSVLIAVAEQLARMAQFEDSASILIGVAEKLPDSTRIDSLLAEIHMALLAYHEAYKTFEGLAKSQPQETYFTEQLFRLENMEGSASAIFQQFKVAVDDSGRKNAIVAKRESLDYTEIKLMWARSLWVAEQWEESLDVYGLLDTEIKRKLDEMKEYLRQIPDDQIVSLPVVANGGVALFDRPEVIDLIMSQEFVSENLSKDIVRTSSLYYDPYRWGKIISKEMTAKSSLKAKEFYQAEIDYKELFQEEAVITEPIYSDLATVYSRLGRYQKETELLEKIKETKVSYPSLNRITEKNLRRRQPYLFIEGTYLEAEGRDGAIDITEKDIGLGVQFRPTLQQDAGVTITRSDFGNSFESSLASSTTMLGNYKIKFSDTVAGNAKLGVEDFDGAGDTFLLYDLLLKATLEQRVELYAGMNQEPVDDTVDSLQSGIYRTDVQLGLSLDYYFGMFFGFDLDFYDYNDENEGEQYYLWSSYRWFGERSSIDITYSYLNLQHELTNELSAEEESGYTLNYWSPGDYWKHRLSGMYKVELWQTGRLQSGTGSFSALYGIGYEKGDLLIHEIDMNILLEITATFLVKGTFSTILSDDYDQLKGLVSLIYRW